MDRSAQTLTIFDRLLDQVAQIEQGESIEQPQATIDRAEQFAKEFDGSLLDLYIACESLVNLGETIQDEIKEDAYSEAELMGDDQRLGVSFYTRESYKKYDYPDDEYINKVQSQIEKVQKNMEPLKESLKPLENEVSSLKDSIKSRKKTLEKEGKAKFKGSTKSIVIKK